MVLKQQVNYGLTSVRTVNNGVASIWFTA